MDFENKENEGDLSEVRLALYRDFIRVVKDYAIFLLSPNGEILTWNEGAERIKGYKKSEILGKHFSIFYSDDALARNHPAHELELAEREGAYSEEGWRLKKDGSRFWASVTITATRDESGRLLGFSKVTQDLTERKNTEDQLRKSEQELRLLSEKLDAKVRERTVQLEEVNKALLTSNADLEQFAGVAAHDLRAPIKTMHGWVDMLEQLLPQPLNSELAEAIGFIKKNTIKADQLIGDLLKVAQINKSQIKTEWVDVNGIVGDVLEFLTEEIESTSAEVSIENLPTVSGNPTHLELVFGNLIRNALLYKAPNRSPRVLVNWKDDGAFYRFSIHDNGIGIPDEYTQRIFEMFNRLHGDSQYPGTGIGLALCKKVIELYKGKIWVESTAGEGSVFSFTYPKLSGDNQ